MTIREVNNIYVTECICYPRSGHHALANVLAAYFGSQLEYCEIYQHPEKQIGDDTQTNYQKNHDFDLRTAIGFDRRYLVQIRDPYEAWASRWSLHRRTGEITDESQENYIETVRSWSDYYAGFMNKWVISSIPNRLVVRYCDLVESPFATVENVIQFLQHPRLLDRGRLAEALRHSPVTRQKRRDLNCAQVA